MMPPEGRIRSCMVFLLTMAMLSLQVALTRIFSFIMHYHFTYLVISVAMLGFGAAGTYLTVTGRHRDAPASNEFLGRMAGLMALAMIAAVALIPRLHFYPLDMYFRKDYSNLLSLLVIMVLSGTPFFFGGTCVACILSRAGRNINRIYFADLTGAAAGCLLVIVLINSFGAIATCFSAAALALLAAIIITAHRRRTRLLGLLAVLTVTSVVAWREPLPLYVPRDKPLFGMEHLVEQIDWHIITRLDVTSPIDVYHSFGGALSPLYTGPAPKVRMIYQDGGALTGILRPTPTPRETPVLGYYLQGAPYKIRPEAEVLVIGCGGGVDIQIAQYHGARHVVGVDVNPRMIDVIRRYDDFARGSLTGRDVELVVAEGRHFLSRDRRRFDVIQLTGVDTFSALATGAYALTENFIYTTEALEQYLGHLKDDGIVNISRAMFTPPRETLKLTGMWMEVLERAGVQTPSEHIVILAGRGQDRVQGEGKLERVPWAQTLVKRSAFTPEEVRALAAFAESLGFDVVYAPRRESEGELAALILAGPEKRRRIIDGHILNIEPATDDKPFFFRFHRWSHLLDVGGRASQPLALIILLSSLVAVVGLSALLIVYPLCRHGSAPAAGGRAGIFTYFAALGLAFILIEITLIQKFMVFLGGPGYSMSITLFTILLASGVGSFLSRNWSWRPLRLLAVVIPLLVLLVAVGGLCINRALPHLMHLSHPLRALVAVAMLGPLGILMGMPFPTGLRLVDTVRPELNPWAWSVNACATVMGAVLCILISASVGFTAALLIAAGVYLVGWIVFAIFRPAPR